MGTKPGAAYDPETIVILQAVVDETWNSLPPDKQARISKSAVAERVLKVAADGERDPIRLRKRAMIGVVPDGVLPR